MSWLENEAFAETSVCKKKILSWRQGKGMEKTEKLSKSLVLSFCHLANGMQSGIAAFVSLIKIKHITMEFSQSWFWCSTLLLRAASHLTDKWLFGTKERIGTGRALPPKMVKGVPNNSLVEGGNTCYWSASIHILTSPGTGVQGSPAHQGCINKVGRLLASWSPKLFITQRQNHSNQKHSVWVSTPMPSVTCYVKLGRLNPSLVYFFKKCSQ